MDGTGENPGLMMSICFDLTWFGKGRAGNSSEKWPDFFGFFFCRWWCMQVGVTNTTERP